MDKKTQDKLAALKKILTEMVSVMVAYSGGVDSTLLLKVATQVLGEKVIAVTAVSDIHISDELEKAKRMTGLLKVKHLVLKTNELTNSDFTNNPPERCYFCKKERFKKMTEIQKELGLNFLIEGTNLDDEGDFRPGKKAVEELGVRSPLKEAGLTKTEIRVISKELNLPTWDKPAAPCLATRIPYGSKITTERLKRIEQCEKILHNLGIKQLRVRDHDQLARIEIGRSDMPVLINQDTAFEIVTRFKELGFIYITLDIEGFRSGSMNEIFKKDNR